MRLNLHIDRHAALEPTDAGDGVTLTPGAVVQYVGYIPGGMVRVRFQDREFVMNPQAAAELRVGIPYVRVRMER